MAGAGPRPSAPAPGPSPQPARGRVPRLVKEPLPSPQGTPASPRRDCSVRSRALASSARRGARSGSPSRPGSHAPGPGGCGGRTQRVSPPTNPGPDSPAACGLCTTPEHSLRRVRLWVLRQIPHRSRFCGLFACPKNSCSTWRLPGLHRPVGGHDEPLVALDPCRVMTEGLNFSSYL